MDNTYHFHCMNLTVGDNLPTSFCNCLMLRPPTPRNPALCCGNTVNTSVTIVIQHTVFNVWVDSKTFYQFNHIFDLKRYPNPVFKSLCITVYVSEALLSVRHKKMFESKMFPYKYLICILKKKHPNTSRSSIWGHLRTITDIRGSMDIKLEEILNKKSNLKMGKAGENACKSFKHSRCPQSFDSLCLSFVLKQYK